MGAESETGRAKTRAEELYELAEMVVEEYGARDGMLQALEPYYFLDGAQDPDQEDEQDETLEVVRLPHGTDVVDLIQAMLSDNELNISVPARSEKKRDLDLADEAERWLQALVAENERAAGQGMLGRAGWLVPMRAVFCARVVFQPRNLKRGEKGLEQGRKPAILLQMRDPLVVYPKFGEDCLLYVVERWERTVADVRSTWGEQVLAKRKADETVVWTELWTDSEYCYWADGAAMAREVGGVSEAGPWKHSYGGLNYVYRFAQQTGLREPGRRGRPLLEAARHSIDAMNLVDTVELTTIREYGGDALVVTSASGDQQKIDLSPLAVNYLRPGESIDWLRASRQPLDAARARAKYESAFQRDTLPYAVYGQDPGRIMSGFSLNLLTRSGQMRIRAVIEAIERGMEDLLSIALMVAENELAPLLEAGLVRAYMRGAHTKQDGTTRTVRQEVALNARELAGYYEVNVTLGEVMPQDDQANVMLALRTQQPGPSGRPLLSWRTTVERFKLVQSPAEERRRIDEEQAAQDPQVVELRRAIFAAKVREELVEEAEELGIDVEEVLARASGGGGGGAAGGQAGQPGPAEMVGLPGQVLPAQMQGMEPSGEMVPGYYPGMM